MMGASIPTIDETIAFIRAAHAGQTDQAGREYHHHPIAVMRRLPEDADEDVKLAALLHDVIEDTPYTREQLIEMGYSARTMTAVDLVTKTRGDRRSYAEKIDAIIASGNLDAIMIKFADMSENLDADRLGLLDPERREKLLKKYSGPIEALRLAVASGHVPQKSGW